MSGTAPSHDRPKRLLPLWEGRPALIAAGLCLTLLTALLLTFGCSKDSNNPVTPPDNTGDTQAPTVSIVSPTANESVGRTALLIEVQASDNKVLWQNPAQVFREEYSLPSSGGTIDAASPRAWEPKRMIRSGENRSAT